MFILRNLKLMHNNKYSEFCVCVSSYIFFFLYNLQKVTDVHVQGTNEVGCTSLQS